MVAMMLCCSSSSPGKEHPEWEESPRNTRQTQGKGFGASPGLGAPPGHHCQLPSSPALPSTQGQQPHHLPGGAVQEQGTDTEVALLGIFNTARSVMTPFPSSSSSQKSQVALKARENLLLLAGLSQEAAATCLVQGSALCQLLTGHLCDLYSAVPNAIDPADVLSMDRASWR